LPSDVQPKCRLPTFVLCTFWLGTLLALPAYLVERAVKGSFVLAAPTVQGLCASASARR
jgi:hypothetical protein